MRLDAIDIADMKPVITKAVRAVLEKIRTKKKLLGADGRLGSTEGEAAEALGIRPRVLHSFGTF